MTALRALARPEAYRRCAEDIGVQLEQRLQVPETAGAAERLDAVERILLNDCASLVPRIMPAPAVGMAMLALAERLLGKDAEPEEFQTVMRSLPHNVTTEMDLELWRLAMRIREDAAAVRALRENSTDELARQFRSGRLRGVVQEGVAEFLAVYGHRAVAEIDLGLPRWSEDPRHILGVLANYLQLDDAERAPDAVFARGVDEAHAMIETLVARSRRRSGIRARLVRFGLERARALVGLRELPKYYVVMVLTAVRRQLAIVGAELVACGRIERADDVFFINLREARAGLGGLDLRKTVAERREAYDVQIRRRHVPRILLSDGTEPEALCVTAVVSEGSLSGTPASAGCVTGTARVILDPVGAKLQPGEILVVPSTDPGWTPLFLTAGGLVMEMGGANSHGAVVAREYGIPAVVGVPEAASRIRSGQRIIVDGSAGTVRVA